MRPSRASSVCKYEPNHNMNTIDQDLLRQNVRDRYSAIAEKPDAEDCGCNSTGCCGGGDQASYGEMLGYSAKDLNSLPDGANLNLGCGNPLAIASIAFGETVLDLGSGAGFDCFLAARQLAGTGRVIGVDMTPSMLSKARRIVARSGFDNVEFRLGEIEHLPVADSSIDVIISNCVINLSPDKRSVFAEAFRVLKPGGRLSIADVVARRPIPAVWLDDKAKISGCLAGAELATDVQRWLREAGFVSVRVMSKDGLRDVVETWDEGKNLGDFIESAMIEGRKP